MNGQRFSHRPQRVHCSKTAIAPPTAKTSLHAFTPSLQRSLTAPIFAATVPRLGETNFLSVVENNSLSASFLNTGALALAAALLLARPAFAQTVYWELEPKKDPAVSIGTYTAVGGKTTPDGVSFTLKNNAVTMPLVMTLISKSASSRLHLSAFKEAKPFLDKDTDGQGRLAVKFRTGEDMRFRITGPAGAEYQLSLWRGPEIKLPESSPVVSMDSVIGKHAAAATAGTMPANAPPPSSNNVKPGEEKSGGGSNTIVYILLAGILVALSVIAFLIHRGQTLNRNGGKTE